MKHVYVMLRADGAVKVGNSKDPRTRRYCVSREEGQAVSIEFQTEPRADARLIELTAQKLLSDKHISYEWFSATVDEAVDAIKKAIDIVEGRAPNIAARMYFSPVLIDPWRERNMEFTAKVYDILINRPDLTINEIAEKVGCKKSAIYKKFPGGRGRLMAEATDPKGDEPPSTN